MKTFYTSCCNCDSKISSDEVYQQMFDEEYKKVSAGETYSMRNHYIICPSCNKNSNKSVGEAELDFQYEAHLKGVSYVDEDDEDYGELSGIRCPNCDCGIYESEIDKQLLEKNRKNEDMKAIICSNCDYGISVAEIYLQELSNDIEAEKENFEELINKYYMDFIKSQTNGFKGSFIEYISTQKKGN